MPPSPQQVRQMERGDSIPLRETENHIRQLFNRYDRDGDGRISIHELQDIINSREYKHDIPPKTVELIMKLSDQDGSGHLDYDEFHDMINDPTLEHVFGHFLKRYCRMMCAPRGGRRVDTIGTARSMAVGDGAYEDEYSWFPPPMSMLIISIIMIALFLVDVVQQGGATTKGPMAKLFIYNPYHREQAWRFVTYMFVHASYMHLAVNLLVQIFLGVALELVHRWWRVVIVYLAGVVAGSLGTSLSDPRVFLAGASGGVYALITAHIATTIMNWKEMEYPILHMLVFLTLVVVDVGNTIYTEFILNEPTNIGYMAHLAGAIAGLLVGIGVLKNLEVRSWEKKLWWAAMVLYFTLMLIAILWNIFYKSHFPQSM